MMKKVIALLLAMLMVFNIAACGEQPDRTVCQDREYYGRHDCCH